MAPDGVQLDLDLGQVQVQGAAPLPGLAQHAIHAVEIFDHRSGPRIWATLRVSHRDTGIDLVIGQPGLGMHDAPVERRAGYIAPPVDPHVADHAQPVDLRLQRAEFIGQFLGQHRHDTVREIHRCAPAPRLRIDRIAAADVMRYVGDGHYQPPAITCRLGIYGIVEIPGILTVDGDERDLSQVDASALVLAQLPRRNGRRRNGCSGHAEGRLNISIAASVSTRGSLGSPSTRTIRPWASRLGSGYSVISSLTIWPGWAPERYRSGTMK